jgi:prepilin-type N-terminal cleavage/methylation domain-containing protein
MSNQFSRRSRRGVRLRSAAPVAGFSLLEMLVVLILVGILAAIAAPRWLAFVNTQRLNIAQGEIYQAMQSAQSQAKLHRSPWQISVRQLDGTVQWATHAAQTPPSASDWKSLDAAIQLDSETTLPEAAGVRRLQFNHKGRVNGSMGRITLSSKSDSRIKRCVNVANLLGLIRTGKEHPKPDDGKFCY